jgi:hypothetical protein
VERGFSINGKNDRLMDQEIEEPSETATITRPRKPVPIFANHDGREMMLFFSLEDSTDRGIAGEER